MPRLLPLLLLTLAACTARIDNSSMARCDATMREVLRAARLIDSVGTSRVDGAYDFALFTSTYFDLPNELRGDGHHRLHVELPPSDRASSDRARCRALDGVDAKHFLSDHDSLRLRLNRAQKDDQGRLYLVALRTARDAARPVIDSLAQFALVRGGFSPRDSVHRRPAELTLTFRNGTGSPVTKAYFRGVLTSPGQATPRRDDEFDWAFPHGLAPGATATLHLRPSETVLRDWMWVRVPEGGELVVTVMKLEGADGRPLWGGIEFGSGDSLALDSLASCSGTDSCNAIP